MTGEQVNIKVTLSEAKAYKQALVNMHNEINKIFIENIITCDFNINSLEERIAKEEAKQEA